MARQVLPIVGAVIGAYFGNPQLGYAIGAMVGNAGRTVILADHSKIGQASRVSFCPVEGIDTLVTDARSRDLPELAALAVPDMVFA